MDLDRLWCVVSPCDKHEDQMIGVKQGRTGQGRADQGRAGQGRPGQGKAGRSKSIDTGRTHSGWARQSKQHRASLVHARHRQSEHSRGRAGQSRVRSSRPTLCQIKPATQDHHGVPVVGVLDSDCQPVTVVELLLEGRLHGLRMEHGGTKERQLCCLIIGEQRHWACTLHQPGI